MPETQPVPPPPDSNWQNWTREQWRPYLGNLVNYSDLNRDGSGGRAFMIARQRLAQQWGMAPQHWAQNQSQMQNQGQQRNPFGYTADPNALQWDPNTGMPIGVTGPPPAEWAQRYQWKATEMARQREAQLWRDAQGSMGQAERLLTSYRPGGAAALASGVFEGRAGLFAGQAQSTDDPDMLQAWREEQARIAAKRARRQQRIGTAMQIFGSLAGPVAGGLFGGGGGGGGGETAGQQFMGTGGGGYQKIPGGQMRQPGGGAGAEAPAAGGAMPGGGTAMAMAGGFGADGDTSHHGMARAASAGSWAAVKGSIAEIADMIEEYALGDTMLAESRRVMFEAMYGGSRFKM